MKGSLLYKRCSNNTTSLIKLSLNNNTSCHTLFICLQLKHIRRKHDHLKKIINTLSAVSRNRTKHGGSAPFLRYKLMLHKLLLNLLNIGRRLIYLINSNDYFNPCSLGMIYSLNSLGHNSVIGSNNQYGDICRLGAAHTHGCKCFMTGSIEESDSTSASCLNLISSDLLRNSSGLLIGYIGLSDGIKKRGLSVVYVTHYRNYRRSFSHLALILILFLKNLGNYVDFLFSLTEAVIFQSDFFCCIKIYFLIYGNNLALEEKILYKLCGSFLKHLGKLLDSKEIRKGKTGNRLILFLGLFNRLLLYLLLFSLGLILLFIMLALLRILKV